ncbi:oligopeptide/dipeptide ABC transporter ATP-binding protein [Streptomyces sp. GTA36]
MPRLAGGTDDLNPIPGSPPGPGLLPAGCAFHPRCPDVGERCATQEPMLLPALPDPPARLVACHYPLEVSGAR